MKIHFVEKFSEGDSDRQLSAMRQVGFKFVSPLEAELIYCASIAKMAEAVKICVSFQKPLAVYCWDYYSWAHGTTTMSGDWREYAEFLKRARIIFVPSAAQQLRLKELLGLDSHVVLTGIPTFEEPVKKGDYILDPVRYYPEENKTWAEDAAQELGLPIIHSEHQYSQAEFQKLVAGCRFIVTALREASTGGLSLIEGLWLGKPALISNSPYMGARDYLGDFGTYFQYNDFNDLKAKMQAMWDKPPKVDRKKARAYISSHLSYDRMATQLYDLCKKTIDDRPAVP